MTTLDVLMPRYHHCMVEQQFVQRRPRDAFDAFQRLGPGDLPLGAWISAARAMLRRDRDAGDRPLWDQMRDAGWVNLLDDPPREVVLGLLGRIWRLDFGVHPVADRTELLQMDRPGYVKLAVSHRFVPQYAGTRVVCEARVQATDADAAHHFDRYWRVIGLGAHLTARGGLHAIKRRAERGRWRPQRARP